MRTTPAFYRPDIDGLRAVAVLAVVLFHAFPGLVPGGFAGVDVFFVISGYLITGIILRGLNAGDFRFIDFYAHRARRILPALLLVLVTCLVLGWYVLLPVEYAQLSRHAAAGAGFVQNFVLWREAGYFDTVTELKPLMHLWSLSIEEQFYLLYPLLLCAAWRWMRRPVLLVAALTVASFGLGLALTATDPVQAFFAPHARMWELLAGGLLAFRGPAAASQHARNTLSLAGLLLLALAYWGLRDGGSYPGWRALLPVAGAALLLYAGPQGIVNRALGCRPLVLIGAISYPLYLWHWPLLAFGRIVDALPATERNGAVVLSFVLAWLTWRLVEHPIRYGALAGLKAAVLCAALVAVGAIAWWAPPQTGNHTARLTAFIAANAHNAQLPQTCRALTGQDHPEDWCNPGNAASGVPDTVLLGDSFANAYTTMLTTDASTRFAQFGRGQCPALLDYGPSWCREIVRAEAAYVAQHAAVRTVVLAGHWPVYAAGQRWSRFDHEESAAAFYDAFRRTVEHYRGLGRHVVVLLSPPTGANPDTCVPRPLHLVEKNICHRTLAQARQSDGDYRATLLPWLAERNVSVFDPYPVLCDDHQCRLMDGERMLYADWLHLSTYGAAWLARQGNPALRAALEVTP